MMIWQSRWVKQCFERMRSRQFTRLFAVALVASLLLGTVDPIFTQSAPLSPKEALQEEIRTLAAEDVENDIARRTQFAIGLYEKNLAGLTAKEIAKTYDEAFNKQSKAKKQDLGELRNPPSGWLIVLLPLAGAAIWAAVGDTLKQASTSLIKAIDDWIYARYAGNRFFREFALKRYQAALAKKFKDLHIPFRVNRPPLDMSKVYVPLKVAGAGRAEQTDAYHAIAEYERLMIVGEPGAGKSMLLKHLALAYGEGRLLLPKRPVPILLELHRLNSLSEVTVETLTQALVKAFERDNFPKAGRFVQHSLKRGTLMLLLDGLDEVNSTIRPTVVQRIKDLLDTCEQCRVIITCREAVYQGEFAGVAEQTLEVVEFSDQQIRLFLGSWASEMPPNKSINQLLQTLRDRPRIMALARNPLLLTIIAYLYTDTPFVLPHSRSEFYQRSTDILLDQWRREHNRFRINDKQRVLQHLALYNQSQSQQRQDRRSIDYAVVLEQIRQILPDLNLNPETDTKPILDEIVERSGLLLKIDGGERYQFAHLTLQEYFAAVGLKDDGAELISRFQQDSTAWQEVVKLWCGLARDSTLLIQAVFEKDPITGFECLADAQKVDQALSNQIVDDFKISLGRAVNHLPEDMRGMGYGIEEAIEKAFGAVAADFRPRGKAVFEFLASVLSHPQESIRYRAAANALAKTNLPQAAETLAHYYGAIDQVRDPLIQMGDLAVPVLYSLAEQGSQLAVKDLFAIATPDAAIALVRLNWNFAQEGIALKSSWFLAALLAQPDIEEALQSYDLLAEIDIREYERLWEQFDWVWKPFLKHSDSDLGVIISRITYDLARSPLHSTPEPLPKLDPRLVVPLCSVYLLARRQPKLTPLSQAQIGIDALLAQDTQTPGLEELINQLVSELLSRLEFEQLSVTSNRLKLLLSGLTPRVQLDLLYRLLVNRQPTQNDWHNIFRPVNYEMRTGWHYRLLVVIAFGLSIAAIFGVFVASNHPIVLGCGGLSIVVIVIFWLTVWRCAEQPLDPDLFMQLGVAGLPTFGLQLRQLFQKQLVWSGIKPLFKALTKSAVALTRAVAGDVAGLGAWFRLEFEPEKDWLRFLAVLAAPWFWWLPIVVGFGGIALNDLSVRFPLPNLTSWQQTGLIEVLLMGVCSLLWWRGTQLDQRARNPLQGGILEAALRGRQV